MQPLRIEHAGSFRERTERGPRAAQFLLHLGQLAGLLQAAQRGDNRIEQVEQHEHAILVVVQLSVAGTIAGTAVVVQPLQEGSELVEVFEPGDLPLRDLLAPLARHDRLLPK